MLEFKPLINVFNDMRPLTEKEVLALTNRAELIQFKRREMVLTSTQVCNYLYFVISGCLKHYLIDFQGKEHTLEFAIENDWIFNVKSFYEETISESSIKAVEPTTVVRIKREDMYFLFEEFPNFDRNFRILAENRLVDIQDHLFKSLSLSAEQKYIDFINRHKKLAERLPDSQIAMYLGVSAEFLSKVKKKLLYK